MSDKVNVISTTDGAIKLFCSRTSKSFCRLYTKVFQVPKMFGSLLTSVYIAERVLYILWSRLPSEPNPWRLLNGSGCKCPSCVHLCTSKNLFYDLCDAKTIRLFVFKDTISVFDPKLLRLFGAKQLSVQERKLSWSPFGTPRSKFLHSIVLVLDRTEKWIKRMQGMFLKALELLIEGTRRNWVGEKTPQFAWHERTKYMVWCVGPVLFIRVFKR